MAGPKSRETPRTGDLDADKTYDRKGASCAASSKDLSEEGAAAALVLVERRRSDPMLRALASAPPDDEPTSPEEDESVRDAPAAYGRGEAVSADEIKRDLGIA